MCNRSPRSKVLPMFPVRALRARRSFRFVVRRARSDAPYHQQFVFIRVHSWLAMITFLHGKLVEALPTQVTVDVNGIGYEALIPLSSFDKLPQPGGEVKLLTHLVVREDAHVLYGFASAGERELFRMLINNVSGIG